VPAAKVTPIVGVRLPRMRDSRTAGDRSVKEIPSVVLLNLDKPHCPMGKQLCSPSYLKSLNRRKMVKLIF
jgi:hypothetical protein